MAGVIRLLSQHSINQIAAGEVIENPASVVKELIENAIDAGAGKVIVEISGGGLQRICVSDDGIGMGPEDALLCLERHATSKIAQAEDLVSVMTMGFRGEALPSIASISKMIIQTCQESGVGTQVEIEGGVISSVNPYARNKGTSIEVCQLFYNVPARRKFQKSQAQCSIDVLKVITQLGLAYPMIGFELYDNKEQKLKLPRGEGSFIEALKKRTEALLGETFLEGSSIIQGSFEPFSFRGILGGVHNTRPNKALQYSFINQRGVLCPSVSYAMKEALGTRIEHDRFPVYVLHLDIPSSFLDVNVHPQKKEVRIREEKWIKEKLKEKVQEALFAEERALASSSLSSAPLSFSVFSSESFFARPREERQEQTAFEPPLFSEIAQTPLFIEQEVTPIGLHRHFLWVDAASVDHLGLEVPLDGVLIVDLKAASSRLLFDSLKVETKSVGQPLLLPLTFSCSLAEAQMISLHLSELEKMGFSCRSVGKQSFLIEEIPALLPEEEALEFLKIAFLEEKAESWAARKERALATACARLLSLRSDNYTMREALAVFLALAKTKIPLFCPLGNKTIISMENEELQQLFSKKGKVYG